MQPKLTVFARTLDRGISLAAATATWLAGTALVLAFLLIFLEVVLRNVFNATLTIGLEYSSYLLVALIFLGLVQAQRDDAMVYMEIVYQRLPSRLRACANVFRYLVALGYGAVAIWFVVKFTASTCRLNQLSSYASMTPLCVPQSVMSIGLVLLYLEWLRGFVRALSDLLSPTKERADH